MADASGARLQERRCEPGNAGQERQAAERYRRELPLWPPRPDDLDGWAAVLAEYPELAPAIECELLRVANELPARLDSRVDRLRLVGNSVDCVVGATAFLYLLARLQEAE